MHSKLSLISQIYEHRKVYRVSKIYQVNKIQPFKPIPKIHKDNNPQILPMKTQYKNKENGTNGPI